MNRRDYIKNTAAALGIGIAGISLSEIMISCRKKVDLAWKPLVFKSDQAAIIAEIAETILPKTQTPGAKDLAVPQFIDALVSKTFDADAQKALKNDIDDFESAVKEQFGHGFLEISAKERTEFLQVLDKTKPRSGMNMWGINLEPDAPKASFFKTIKGLTLFGFYTSEEIGKNVLAYDPVPGPYIACMPLENRNVWSE